MKKTSKKRELSFNLRQEVECAIFDLLYDGMFGGGMNEDHIWEGVNFIGINNMTDEQLVEEFKIQNSIDEEKKLNMRNPQHKLYKQAMEALGKKV